MEKKEAKLSVCVFWNLLHQSRNNERARWKWLQVNTELTWSLPEYFHFLHFNRRMNLIGSNDELIHRLRFLLLHRSSHREKKSHTTWGLSWQREKDEPTTLILESFSRALDTTSTCRASGARQKPIGRKTAANLIKQQQQQLRVIMKSTSLRANTHRER